MSRAKEDVFDFVQRTIYGNEEFANGLTTSQVAQQLNMQRTNVSALLNALVKEGRLFKTESRPVLYFLESERVNGKSEKSPQVLIGEEGSLKNAVQLAQAAILYPSKRLNTLLTGNLGNGTTYFVNYMHKIALQNRVMTKDSPLIHVNCRNYVKDITSLNPLLFGQQEDFQGSWFEKAQGGILFIDHYDFLDAYQQSKILEFLEQEAVITLESGETLDLSDIFIILSSAVKLPVNRKIPVIIELPDLNQRPLKEKLALIHHFFSKESSNAERTIVVPTDIIRTLLLTEFAFNVKEMKMAIVAACANAYVRVVHSPNQDVEIVMADFKLELAKALLKRGKNDFAIEELLGDEQVIVYEKASNSLDQRGQIRENMYLEINHYYEDLLNKKVSELNIQKIINGLTQKLYKNYSYRGRFDTADDEERLAKIVEPKIIEIVKKWLEYCSYTLNRSFKANIFYGLCLHINSLLALKQFRSQMSETRIQDLIQLYPDEYALSVQLAMKLKDQYALDLPIEEIIIITMFLVHTEEEKTGHPVLLYIMHGDGTAKSLMETTQNFTQTDNVYSYDMALTKGISVALKEIKELIMQIDQNQGVIVVYDMGSIKAMLETIAEETNIKIRPIHMPITLIGIDIARKCSMESDIEYVYHTVNMETKSLFNKRNERSNTIIVTLCETGEGGALQLKRYIDNYSKLGLQTVPFAISEKDKLLEEIISLRKTFHIHAFVGTYDPKLLGIPFIPIHTVFQNKKEDLDRVLMFDPMVGKYGDFEAVYHNLEESLRFVPIERLKTILPQVITDFNIIYDLEENQLVGLFMHLASLIDRLLSGGGSIKNREKDKIINAYPEDYRTVGKVLKKVERNFKIMIDDDELATIIMILRKV